MAATTESETPEHGRRDRVLTTYTLDVLCGGGFSIILMGVFLCLVRTPLTATEFTVEKLLLVNVVVNWPHFIASYALLYGSSGIVRRYRWASTYFPLLLLVYCAYALFESVQLEQRSVHYTILYGVAAFYLAIHYTGQAWGTTATFAYLEEFSLSPVERRLLRGGLWILAGWQMTWLCHQHQLVPQSLQFYGVAFHALITICAVASLLCGVIVLARASLRNGRIVPLRVLLPWLSIYLWYALIQIIPGAFFWLQIAHAIQYLVFPARVEMNRFERPRAPAVYAMVRHLLLYYLALIVMGYAAFAGITLFVDTNTAVIAAEIVAVFINIHHYFVDGCIWKLRNPAVRKDLFAHL